MTDSTSPLTLDQARAEISAILDRIPDDELPQPSEVREATDDRGPCVWFNDRSHGFYVGSGKKNGQAHPIDWHRDHALGDVFDREAAQRYERDWWLEVAAAVGLGITP